MLHRARTHACDRGRAPAATLSAAAAALLAAHSFAVPCAAQQRPPASARADTIAAAAVTHSVPALPFAPGRHWSRDVLRRLALDGAIDAGAATATWPIAQTTVASLLRAAARDTTPARFAARFSGERQPYTDTTSALRGLLRFGVGGAHRNDALRAGISQPDPSGYRYTGPVAVDDRTGDAAHVEIEAGWRTLAARHASDVSSADGIEIRELYGVARAGPLDVWLGRKPLSFGATARGGIVLGDGARFDGVGVETSRPFRLPSFLRALGDVRVSQTVARMDRSGDVAHPWFLATRVSFAPTGALAIGLQRAAIFGGEDNEGVNARRVLLMLLGFSDVAGKDSDFENQVASIDVYWRLPASLPLALYGEYGTEDTGFAFVHVPAVIAGIEAAPRRGSTWSAALEHVRFARSTRDYPEWYRHGALGGGWTDLGVPLGHALGGHAHGTSLTVRHHDARRGVVAEVRASALRRGAENLYAPDRQGGAFGVDASIVWFIVRRVQLSADVDVEWGGGWTRAVGAIGVSVGA